MSETKTVTVEAFRSSKDHGSSEAPGWVVEAHRSIAAFRELAVDWDSYGADPPNETAIRSAQRVLGVLAGFDFKPSGVSPSAEGGICFWFDASGVVSLWDGGSTLYADIECFNDSEVLAVTSDGKGNPDVWEVGVEPDLKGTIGRIRGFLGEG